jgi:four helix bundle protein
MGESLVKQKSYEFALRIVKLCTHLREGKHYEISSQPLRSGTSLGANVEEALAGQSRKDFFAKICTASKEARETNYWLRLVGDSGLVKKQSVQGLRSESDELIKILTSIVKTCSADQKTKNSKLETQN